MVVGLVVMLDYLLVAMTCLAALITEHYGPAKIFKQDGLDQISTAFCTYHLLGAKYVAMRGGNKSPTTETIIEKLP